MADNKQPTAPEEHITPEAAAPDMPGPVPGPDLTAEEAVTLEKEGKAARYSKKYLAEHEAELAAYRAARAAMNDILNGAKLPKMDALKKSRRELTEKKKALYLEFP